MEKKSEKKALGIIAIVLGVIALLGSWVPIFNNISFFLGLLALLLGLIGIFVNRKNTKTLAIVGTALAAVSMAVVLITQSMYSKALDDASKAVETAVSEVETSMSSSQAAVDENFKWTKADFDALVVGETLSGVGGTNLDEIIAKFGEPQTSSESSSENYTTKYVDYNTMGGTEYKSVSLQFVQQEDGSWLLSYKNSSGIE
ncbi:CD20-like domain-containing protein [Streptococcus parasuis]|uniref:CD20-like domain-containing protein n=1 Tax=Streptococcus parasuis TaxID=1501662 RepID=UPI0028AE04ED|nr:CD20-like domain-containing protein [Streptococcus parasuis]